MSPENRVDVEIFGEYYKLKGEASPEYMVRLARYVDQVMHKVMQRNPKLTVHKAAILAAINIADELWRTLDYRGDEERGPEDYNGKTEVEKGDRQSKKVQGKNKKKKKKKA